MAKKDIGLLIKNINDSLEKQVNFYFNTIGLTLSQVRVLDFIFRQTQHRTTQKQLETYLNVAHPTINGILKRLEDKQLVATEITVDERLTKIVLITDKGIEAYKLAGKSRTSHEKMLTSNLTPEEKSTLVSLLEKVIDGLPLNKE